MGTALRLIAFSIAKNYILPRIIDEIINVLESWAKRTEFTDIDDHVVKGIRAHRDEIVREIKKAI